MIRWSRPQFVLDRWLRRLHSPSAGLESGLGELFMGLFAPLLDARGTVPFDHCDGCRRTLVACIGAEIALTRSARHLHHELVQRGFKQFHVMGVCAAGAQSIQA
jgi:hypothetical protein